MMLVPYRRKANRPVSVFDEFFGDSFFRGDDFMPSSMMNTDVKEEDNKYLLAMDVPGLSKDDIKIELENGYLNVSAEKKEENESKDEEGKYIHKERVYSSSSRRFYVGNTVTEEDIKANLKDGVLNLEIPKKEELPEKKYIEIE